MSDDDFWAFDSASVTTNLNDLWGDEEVNNTITTLPVVAPIINPVASPRPAAVRSGPRCSFCRMQGHTVNRCNSNELNHYENLLNLKKYTLLHRNNLTVYQKIFEFEQWLTASAVDDSSYVKAYAVKKCGCYTRDRIGKCITFVTRFIWAMELSQLVFVEQNLFENEHREDGWFIDLTGDYNLSNTNKYNNIEITCLEKEINTEEGGKLTECSICYEEIEDLNMVKFNCNHDFCGLCVKTIIEKNNNPCCAFCRCKIEKIEVKNKEIENIFK
jgi:hypothetical protein